MKIMNLGKAHASHAFASRQRGAVFFVALMLLIVLTLLGLSAAQVTALQERMAAVYRSDRMAFENAESRLVQMERSTRGLTAALNPLCENLYVGAANTGLTGEGATVENLARGGASFITATSTLEASIAREIGDTNCLFLQISASASDDPTGGTSRAILQSIFVP